MIQKLIDVMFKEKKYLRSAFVVFEHEIDAKLILHALRHKSLIFMQIKKCFGCVKKEDRNIMSHEDGKTE